MHSYFPLLSSLSLSPSPADWTKMLLKLIPSPLRAEVAPSEGSSSETATQNFDEEFTRLRIHFNGLCVCMCVRVYDSYFEKSESFSKTHHKQFIRSVTLIPLQVTNHLMRWIDLAAPHRRSLFSGANSTSRSRTLWMRSETPAPRPPSERRANVSGREEWKEEIGYIENKFAIHFTHK